MQILKIGDGNKENDSWFKKINKKLAKIDDLCYSNSGGKSNNEYLKNLCKILFAKKFEATHVASGSL